MILINFSSHPSASWSEDQKLAAQEQFGEIIDFPFPLVRARADLDEVKSLAKYYFGEIVGRYGPDIAINVAGESTFTFQFVDLCRTEGIYCVCATSEPLGLWKPDDSRTSGFEFQRFRPYF